MIGLEEKKSILEKEGYTDIKYIGDDLFECKIKGKIYKKHELPEIIYVEEDGDLYPAPRW